MVKTISRQGQSSTSSSVWPKFISSEMELDEVMTRPSPRLVKMMKGLVGDIAILGIAGKMGVTLGQLALRACAEAGVRKRILGVSRFSDATSRQVLEKMGIETIRCDLLDDEAVAELPKVKNVVFMAGKKFGTVDSEALTWVMNTIVPGNVARHFKKSRIVVFSTGCVYPLVSIKSGGCKETDPADPVGGYAQSCLGRERVFEYFSREHGTSAVVYRLNYAIDLRYGVFLDVAKKVWNQERVDLTMGYANVIWQGDANSAALLCLEHASSPPTILNVTGSETIAIRKLAQQFGSLLGRKPRFAGKESATALLSNSSLSHQVLEQPRVTLSQMIEWTAHWVKSEGKTLNKPTHFEVRDGKF